MNVTILNTSGSSLGPFNIYYNTIAPPYLLTSSITSASLAAGFNLDVPDATTTLYVVNTRTGCNTIQSIAVPPPITPITYQNVTIQARFAEDTALPQTASAFYMVDSQGWNYLGDITNGTCSIYPSIPVPTNSTLLLGIVSASYAINFAATGTAYLCSNGNLPTTYCGISSPYFERIYNTAVVSLMAKVQAGSLGVCGITPVPPGPFPPPVVPASLTYSGNNSRGLIQMTIDRSRTGSPDARILDTRPQAPIPTGLIDQTTIPNILPGDVLTITIVSAEPPRTQWGVVMVIENQLPTGEVTLYSTYNNPSYPLGYTVQDTYVLTVQSAGVYSIAISDFV